MRNKQRLRIQATVLAVAAVAIFLDQFVKALVISSLNPGVPVSAIGEILQWNLVYNDSAAFSLGFGATWIFTIISTLAALFLLAYSAKISSLSWAVMAGVALGGVTGNLIDRLTRAPGFGIGEVVDFIQIPFNFPLFNIADSCIVVVAVITVIRILLGHQIGKKTNNV